MRKRWIWFAAFAVIAVGGAYWLLMLPSKCEATIAIPSLRVVKLHSKAQRSGTLVGVQPFMQPVDYACAERFEQKLRAYMDTLRATGCLRESTIVVFPEYIGTWLVLLGEASGTYQAKTLQGALTWAVIRQPLSFWRAYRQAKEEGWTDPSAVAAFRLKAPLMAKVFHQTFAKLARTYKVYIVAGSIVLPGACVVVDSLSIQIDAPLENISLLYRPDGRPDTQVVRKAFPIAEELGFTQPGRVDELPVYETPLGRLGVLICADSWFPQSYEALGAIDLLAVPSYLMGDACWEKPWRGYSGWEAPSDVDSAALTEGQAWLRYAMGGRLARYDSNAVGINVFLKGRFWELGADGRLTSVLPSQGTVSSDADVVCLELMPPHK